MVKSFFYVTFIIGSLMAIVGFMVAYSYEAGMDPHHGVRVIDYPTTTCYEGKYVGEFSCVAKP